MSEIPPYDRRVDDRLSGAGLRAHVNGCDHALADFSVGGARVLGIEGVPGDRLEVVLVDGAERIIAAAVVRGSGPGFVSVEFPEPTYALMSCILRQREAERP